LITTLITLLLIIELAICATCQYSTLEGKYHCELKDAYVLTKDSTLEISGEHIENFTDANVHSVTVKSSVIHYLDDAIFIKFPNIEVLHVINVEIFEIKPFSFCNHLQVLSIEDEELETLPSRAFQNCLSIREISVNNNLEVLPDDVFYGADSLEKLTLENNKLEKIPNLTNLKNLSHLNLGMNKLEKLEVKKLFKRQLIKLF
jgi:Leucine-rich repeat (LRR) protein